MSEETKELSIYEKLAIVQLELKVQKIKAQGAVFKSRSCEEILAHAKPLLDKNRLVVLMRECVEYIGERHYIISTAKLIDLDSEDIIETTSPAGESTRDKMIDESQATGKAISYARKYALGGLFAIDDTNDSDREPAQQPQIQYITVDQCAELQSLVDNNTVGREPVAFKSDILKHHNINSFSEIPAASFTVVKSNIMRAE